MGGDGSERVSQADLLETIGVRSTESGGRHCSG